MKTNKEYRFKDNPKEKEMHDKFIDMFSNNNMSKTVLSAIVFGWENDRQEYPKEWLTEKEEDICLNIIQWLGSPVGQGFLEQCGFILKNSRENKFD